MDLIRIFIDTAFARVARRYLSDRDARTPRFSLGTLAIDEPMFIDQCRIRHPELSDDQIRTIYSLFRDEWSHSPEAIESGSKDEPNIFNVIFRFTERVLRLDFNTPQVRFNHLFRWREVTQMIGEDLPVAAFLAYKHRYSSRQGLNLSNPADDRDIINFCGWPTILHNDNPHLRHIFEKHGLAELHSHLKASTDNFAISWVSLMNRVVDREKSFRNLARIHDRSREEELATFLHENIVDAASIRLNLWRYLDSNSDKPDSRLTTDTGDLQAAIDSRYRDQHLYDYIPYDVVSPMGVFAGERRFLFAVCEDILRRGNVAVTNMFYRYLLIKNLFRSFIIQVNDNKGFSNFKRFQDQKSVMLLPKHKKLLVTLPFWEAYNFNYVRHMETRIVPSDKLEHFKGYLRDIESIRDSVRPSDKQESLDWSFIFHFIKVNIDTNPADGTAKDAKLKTDIFRQSTALKRLTESVKWRDNAAACLQRIRGIDAASSEIGCRPEVFAQAFRYLKSVGFNATFHVGEDFYDIVDGLRAIQEAILFLGLESGDRLGHAMALGLSPEKFYSERHNTIALPRQWMLDNVTWLYFKSREYDIRLSPETENFLLTVFRQLSFSIGYASKGEPVDIYDYYCSMQLRGDNPKIYFQDLQHAVADNDDTWRHYDRIRNESCDQIRLYNPKAIQLLKGYQTELRIKENGRKIQSFCVPKSYAGTVRDMQEAMISRVSKLRLGIECCPSSNVRIGYFHRFDEHPILRFFPPGEHKAKYPLTVTVNTDDLGVFSTSLPNEFSLLALGLMKKRDAEGKHIYSSEEVYDWIEDIVVNNSKYCFRNRFG